MSAANDQDLVALVGRALKDTEPRTLPTETINNGYHDGWKCPYCGQYCRRHNRRVYDRCYGGFNSHFAKAHSTPDWKAKHIIKVIENAGHRTIEKSAE